METGVRGLALSPEEKFESICWEISRVDLFDFDRIAFSEKMRFFGSNRRMSLLGWVTGTGQSAPTNNHCKEPDDEASFWRDIPQQCILSVLIWSPKEQKSPMHSPTALDCRHETARTVICERDVTADELVERVMLEELGFPPPNLIEPNLNASHSFYKRHVYRAALKDRTGLSRQPLQALVVRELLKRRQKFPECTLVIEHSVEPVGTVCATLGNEKVIVPRGSALLVAMAQLRAHSGRHVDIKENLTQELDENNFTATPHPTATSDNFNAKAKNSPNCMSELVKAIGRDTANYLCADCKASNPAFIVCTMAVLVCSRCALEHVRNIDAWAGRVRPIRDYLWSAESVAIVKAGGNSADLAFRSAENFQNIKEKYSFRFDERRHQELITAIQRQDILQVMHALQNGANPNQPINCSCGALHLACYLGCPSIIELLLRYGADPGARDALGRTPLFYAASLEANSDFTEGIVEKLCSYQRFYAFLSERHDKEPHELITEWTKKPKTPSLIALEALHMTQFGDTLPFEQLVEVVFKEVECRGQASKLSSLSNLSLESVTCEVDLNSRPFGYFTHKQYRRLLDGVLEELGFREYINLHSTAWRFSHRSLQSVQLHERILICQSPRTHSDEEAFRTTLKGSRYVTELEQREEMRLCGYLPGLSL